MRKRDFDYYGSDVDLRGIKFGLVVSNHDPKGTERVLIRILGVHDMENDNIDNAVWAEHCSPTKWASGGVPEKDDWLYCMFMDHKDPMKIIWLGHVIGMKGS